MRKSRQQSFFVVTLVTAFFILAHFTGLLLRFEALVRGIISPVSKKVYSWSLSLHESTESFSEVKDLEAAYSSLRKEKEIWLTEHAKLILLKKENEELRQISDIIAKNEYSLITTEVIGKNIDPLGSSLIVSLGDKKVAVGDAVIVPSGVLIGKVARVNISTAVIRLIDDPQSRIAATLLNQEKSIGIVQGGFGLSVRLESIPQDAIVQIGDIIITSGLEGSVPRGLVIGQVDAVEKEAYQPFQKAILTPATDLDKIRILAIITPVLKNE